MQMHEENEDVKLHLGVFCEEVFSHLINLHFTPYFDGSSYLSLVPNSDWLHLNITEDYICKQFADWFITCMFVSESSWYSYGI